MTDFKWRAEHITNKEYERHSMMMMINVQRVSRVCGWFQECFNLSYWVCYNSYSRPYTIYYIQNHIRWDAMRHSRRCQANFHHKYHVIEHSLWDQIPSKLSFPNYDWVKIEIFGCGWIESNKLLKSDTHKQWPKWVFDSRKSWFLSSLTLPNQFCSLENQHLDVFTHRHWTGIASEELRCWRPLASAKAKCVKNPRILLGKSLFIISKSIWITDTYTLFSQPKGVPISIPFQSIPNWDCWMGYKFRLNTCYSFK